MLAVDLVMKKANLGLSTGDDIRIDFVRNRRMVLL